MQSYSLNIRMNTAVHMQHPYFTSPFARQLKIWRAYAHENFIIQVYELRRHGQSLTYAIARSQIASQRRTNWSDQKYHNTHLYITVDLIWHVLRK